jgi:hypothetical protein
MFYSLYIIKTLMTTLIIDEESVQNFTRIMIYISKISEKK